MTTRTDYPAVRKNEGKARLVGEAYCSRCGERLDDKPEYYVERHGPGFYYSCPGCKPAEVARAEG